MKFRKRLFTVLTILFALYVCVGVELANNATDHTIATMPDTIGNPSAYALGAGIGGFALTMVELSKGLPLYLFCLFLAWRNAVGLTAERRHKELIERS
jgi:hypothetical protein